MFLLQYINYHADYDVINGTFKIEDRNRQPATVELVKSQEPFFMHVSQIRINKGRTATPEHIWQIRRSVSKYNVFHHQVFKFEVAAAFDLPEEDFFKCFFWLVSARALVYFLKYIPSLSSSSLSIIYYDMRSVCKLYSWPQGWDLSGNIWSSCGREGLCIRILGILFLQNFFLPFFLHAPGTRLQRLSQISHSWLISEGILPE